ncbi:MAG: hypothetical protein COU66_01905 [Candidatus Pacebacteria bacterium CG10_big_fil_rev_8_21_14_0_10_44_11]|nr:MAG: hypothetical protein COU66_01905 [Candidatus Pacebacteria bacterium CG10_big_fil_rev_8_21_14_0_10_44_11]
MILSSCVTLKKRGALPEIEHLSIKRILQAFDDLVQLGFVKIRLNEIRSLEKAMRSSVLSQSFII